MSVLRRGTQDRSQNPIALRARGTFIEHGREIEAFVSARVTLGRFGNRFVRELSQWTRTMFAPGRDARPVSVRDDSARSLDCGHRFDAPFRGSNLDHGARPSASASHIPTLCEHSGLIEALSGDT